MISEDDDSIEEDSENHDPLKPTKKNVRRLVEKKNKAEADYLQMLRQNKTLRAKLSQARTSKVNSTIQALVNDKSSPQKENKPLQDRLEKQASDILQLEAALTEKTKELAQRVPTITPSAPEPSEHHSTEESTPNPGNSKQSVPMVPSGSAGSLGLFQLTLCGGWL